MDELPRGMLRMGRAPDPEFADDESLYRAFEPDALDGNTVHVDALPLPDMSVNRGKYGPPQWLLLLDRFHGFGIATFLVADFPKELIHQGAFRFTFDIIHKPTENNYPHSVIRAFDEYGKHIQEMDKLAPDLHLRWRNRLRQELSVIIRPSAG